MENQTRHNVKETAIRQYIIDNFIDNPLEIPFTMGTFDTDEHGKELYIHSLSFGNGGNFDIVETFDPTTYAMNRKSAVIIEPSGLSGDFVSHPQIESGDFQCTVEILVSIESPISELIRMMIENVRNKFIGKLGVLSIFHRDFGDDEGLPVEKHYKIVSNAGSLAFGSPFIINGRKYMIYSFPIYFSVAKDIMFGNQVEWKIGVFSDDGVAPLEEEMLIARPIVASWGKVHDLEPFQTLRGKTDNIKAKELHNFVKTRGFSVVLTYLVNLKDPLIRLFYKETFRISDKDKNFLVEMKTKELQDDGTFDYEEDLAFSRKMIGEIFMPEDVVIGEPVVLSVGLSPSAVKTVE